MLDETSIMMYAYLYLKNVFQFKMMLESNIK